MPARYSKHINVIQGLVDLTLIGLVYFLNQSILTGINKLGNYHILLLYISFLVASLIYKPYKDIRTSRLSLFIRKQASFLSVQALIIIIVLIIKPNVFYSLAFFQIYAEILLSLILYRVFYFYFFNWYRKKGHNFRNIVIVGYGKTSVELVKTFKDHPEYGYKFLGYFSDESSSNGQVHPTNDLYNFCILHNVDQIFCCIPYVTTRTIKKIIEFSEINHIKVNITTDFRSYINKGFDFEKIENIPVISLSYSPLENNVNRLLKRLIDVIVSLLFVITLYIPLYIIIGLLIKLDSKGPILFKQKRIGLKNDIFTCLKFRTMGYNEDSETEQAVKNDLRVTKIGAFLRRTSLDEVPQFINVLKGEMSLIGPRPHMVKQAEQYSNIVKRFMARHYVLPGMTGLAQVKGYRGEVRNIRDIANRIKYDKFYIENWSVLLDIEIFFKTILIIIKGDENAY